MGVWGFVTVGRKDVENQSDKDNLRVADFIFQSFAKMKKSKRLSAAQGARHLAKLTM